MSPPIRHLNDMPWLDDPDVRQAREFAIAAHGDQKYGALPYNVHLDDVVACLYACDASKDELMAGYLHDIDEDCPHITRNALYATFGSDVTDMAVSVGSREKERAKAQAIIVAQLTEQPRGALIKLCDRVCNMRACLQDGKTKKLDQYIAETPLYAPVFDALARGSAKACVTELLEEFYGFLWDKRADQINKLDRKRDAP